MHDTAELDQQSVARRLEEPAVVRVNRGVEQVAPDCPQCCEGALLIRAHQT
jgi:hypothetical protein